MDRGHTVLLRWSLYWFSLPILCPISTSLSLSLIWPLTHPHLTGNHGDGHVMGSACGMFLKTAKCKEVFGYKIAFLLLFYSVKLVKNINICIQVSKGTLNISAL